MFGFFKNRKKPATTSDQASAASDDQRIVTFVDVYGRSFKMPVTQWRQNVLKPNLQANWDKPDQLYSFIISALRDNLAADVDEASARLMSIDPIIERGAVARAIVQLKLGHVDDAETTIRHAIAKVGETGTLLTNKAKVIAARGDQIAAMAMLDRSLRLDPNQDNGLMWRVAALTEESGADVAQQYLQDLAYLANAWRPQLLLGQHAIKAGRREEGLAWFDQVLARAPHGNDVMLIISGELGKQGLIADAVQRIAPIYDEHSDDIRAGYNLLQAYVELGDAVAGQALLNRLFALGQPAYTEQLNRYSKLFDDMVNARPQPIDHEPEISVLQMPLPPWLLGMHDMTWAAPPRRGSAERVVLLPLSAKITSGTNQPSAGHEDERGRLSRSLPLLVLEQLVYCSDLDVAFHLPVADGHNLVLFGQPVNDEALEQLAEHFAFAVEGEIEALEEDAFHIIYRLRRLSDLVTIAVVERRFIMEECGNALIAVSGEMLKALGVATSTLIEPRTPFYKLPSAYPSEYISALAQTLALTLSDSAKARESLFGERNIYGWLQTLAANLSNNGPAQFMYFTGLAKGRRLGSPIVDEFERPAVQRMHELVRAGSYSARLLPLIAAVYPNNDELFEMLSSAKPVEDASYAAWCGRVGEAFRSKSVASGAAGES